LKVVGHVEPNAPAGAGPDWSQQLRYGERTARGIAEGKKACCALTVLWERRRAKSDKRIMVSRDTMRDIALFRPSVTSGPGKKKIEEGMTTRRVESDTVVAGCKR
jgi:hypothetical protein